MIDLSGIQTQSILTSAVVVSTAAFVFRLAGGLLADGKIYQDNRKWIGEFVGPIFVISFLAWPSLVAARLLGLGDIRFFSWHGLRMLAVFVIQTILYALVEAYSEQRNGRRSPVMEWVRKFTSTPERTWFQRVNLFEALARYLLLPFLTGSLIYVCIPEFLNGGIVWAAFFACQFFITLVFMIDFAVVLQAATGKANIYFRAGEAPMMDAILLKVNEKNARVIHDGSAHILNMDGISRIEMRLDQKTRLSEEDLKARITPKSQEGLRTDNKGVDIEQTSQPDSL